MATTNPVSETAPTSLRSGASLLVVAAAMPPQQLESILACLTFSLPADEVLIATPNGFAAEAHPSLRVVNFPTTNIAWRITAADFINAYQLAQKNDARGIVMLGPESGSLNSQGLCDLANAVLGGSADLAMPRYDLPPHAALVNSAILYPLTRALFACRTRFPLGIDLGLSLRMAERLAGVAQRFSTLNQEDALLWPVSEALVAGYTVDEFAVGPRDLPQPPAELNINAILALVTGSLFADIEAKAAFWQRPRRLSPARYPIPEVALADGTSDIVSMIDAFRLAYTNLLEIWSLVLPPNTLLAPFRSPVPTPASTSPIATTTSSRASTASFISIPPLGASAASASMPTIFPPRSTSGPPASPSTTPGFPCKTTISCCRSAEPSACRKPRGAPSSMNSSSATTTASVRSLASSRTTS